MHRTQLIYLKSNWLWNCKRNKKWWFLFFWSILSSVGINLCSFLCVCYSYELDNGQIFSEKGELRQIGEEQAVVKTGAYSFVSPDGVTHWVTYTADENGFHPIVGAFLMKLSNTFFAFLYWIKQTFYFICVWYCHFNLQVLDPVVFKVVKMHQLVSTLRIATV